MVKQPRFCRLLPLSALVLVLSLNTACEVLLTTPFPDFLGYTDISVDLDSEVGSIWSGTESIEYRMQVVASENEDPRLLLLVEPPTESGSSGFRYRGRLLVFDSDLNLLNTTAPLSDLDTFGRPFAFGPDGNILAGNTILDRDGLALDTLPFLGVEGPGVTALNFTTPSALAFSLPPGEFTGFDLEWVQYTDDTFPWTVANDNTIAILPPDNRPSSVSEGFQVLNAAFHPTSDQVTLLLSQPATQRVMAVRFNLPDLLDGGLTELATASNDFPISLDADRPLDTHATSDGFFLRRRDGWIEYHPWTSSGSLRSDGSPVQIVGDRSFNRSFAFLATGEQQFMYRFDPGSRVLTRYRRWW